MSTPDDAAPTPPAEPDPAAPRPALRVVRGNPTDEELAALVVVLSAGGPPARPAPDKPRIGRWADPGRMVRGPLPTGPGAWRAATSR